MNIKECYELMGGDYNEILLFMGNETRIKKYLLKFKEDTTLNSLYEAMNEHDYKDAFHHAHTLKGICLNLCMTDLAKSSSELTEALRAENTDIAQLYERVQADYQKAIYAIEELFSQV